MNISISLFKRTGLTEKQVEDIVGNAESRADKLSKELEQIKGNIDFWKRQLKKQSPTKKCTVCKEQIDLWPLNDTEAYYVDKNKITHQKCIN